MKNKKYQCSNCKNSDTFELRNGIGSIFLVCAYCGEPVGTIDIKNKFRWLRKPILIDA